MASRYSQQDWASGYNIADTIENSLLNVLMQQRKMESSERIDKRNRLERARQFNQSQELAATQFNLSQELAKDHFDKNYQFFHDKFEEEKEQYRKTRLREEEEFKATMKYREDMLKQQGERHTDEIGLETDRLTRQKDLDLEEKRRYEKNEEIRAGRQAAIAQLTADQEKYLQEVVDRKKSYQRLVNRPRSFLEMFAEDVMAHIPGTGWETSEEKARRWVGPKIEPPNILDYEDIFKYYGTENASLFDILHSPMFQSVDQTLGSIMTGGVK